MTVLRSRFFWKLYASYAALILIAVVTAGIPISRHIERETIDETQRFLREQALLLRALAVPSLEHPSASAQQRVRELSRGLGTRLTIVASDGTVLADSEREPAGMDNHLNRPEILAAADSGSGTAVRFSTTVGRETMYHAVEVRNDSATVGFVRTALPLSHVSNRVAHIRSRVTTGAVVAAIVALAVGLVIGHGVTEPLASMTVAAKSIANGKYHQRVDARGGDEIAALSHAFNRMAHELEARVAAISEDRTKVLTILGGMLEGVVAVDTEHRVLHANAAAAKLMEVAPDASIGRSIDDISRLPKLSDTIKSVLAGKDEVRSELRIVDGTLERIFEIHGSPLQGDDGAIEGAILVLNDVTELRRLETIRSDFVANVSHELKTPITAIKGMVDTVIEHQDMTEETRQQFLQKIQDQTRRLSLLVSDLLTLARIESSGFSPQARELDLRDVVRTALTSFQNAAESRSVYLESEIPKVPVRVHGDAELLELAVNNLVDNALKYSSPEGTVRISLSADREGALLEVEDDGIGIAPEHHERIFERFYRVDDARSRELGGTGLGLSIVKHVCFTHGGTACVESAPGTGTTFYVRLPTMPIPAQTL
ncbi:MAG: ATP-binding protein [Gemmatimonadales bacterium]